MASPSETLLKNTVNFWQARTLRTFSIEDARASIENIAGFFGLIEQWTDVADASPCDNSGRMEIA
jgi:hypothetical protein